MVTRTKFLKFKSKHILRAIRYPESCSIKNGGLTVTSYQVPAVPVISFIVGGNTTPRAPKALVRCNTTPYAAVTGHCSLFTDLKLPKLGIVKASLSRSINGKIKFVTVSKTSTGKYFAAILFKTDDLTTTKFGKYQGLI
jgi:putative transposase